MGKKGKFKRERGFRRHGRSLFKSTVRRSLNCLAGKRTPTKRDLKLQKNKPVWFVIIFVSRIKMAWASTRAIDLFENGNWE